MSEEQPIEMMETGTHAMKLHEFSQRWHGSDLYSNHGAPISSTKSIDVLYKSALESKKGGRIIEFGSGRGGALEKLAKYTGSSPVATDINPIFVENLKANGYEAYVVNVEDRLPFDNLMFDVVYSDQVLEHLICPPRFLDEIRRIMKDDGVLLLGVPNIMYYEESAYCNPVHYGYYTKKSLAYTLRAIGYAIDFVSCIETRNVFKRLFYNLSGKSTSGAIYAQARKDLHAFDKKVLSLAHQAEIEKLNILFRNM